MSSPIDSRAREPMTFATAPRYEHDGTIFLDETAIEDLVRGVMDDHCELLRRLAER